MTGPFAEAAWKYRNSGWMGTIPLPAGQKKDPPKGWTGADGGTPSPADVTSWVETHGNGNIALRLPQKVVGIDVDAYGTKAGGTTLADRIEAWGPLPDTWTSTSRTDGVSGIKLFIIPTGLKWPTEVGPGIDVIHHGHRYALAWPSVHPLGGTYGWIGPDGRTSHGVPRVQDLPDLPEAWVTGITNTSQSVTASTDGFVSPDPFAPAFVLPDVIPIGQREGVLFKYASSLRGRGTKISEAVRLMRAAHRRLEQEPDDEFTVEDALAKLDSAWGYDYGADAKSDDGDRRPAIDAGPLTEAVSIRLADVEPEHVDWLWAGRLPLGKLVILDGDPSVGKSTVAVDCAARVSTGTAWPDGSPNRVGSVVLLSAEDGLADTIRPRLDAAGGDPTRVHALTEVSYRDGDVIRTRATTLADIEAIEALVRSVTARLVVVDVLMAFLPGKVNSHSDQEMRAVLSALAAMAERTRCCVLLLRHLNKQGGGSVLYRGGGSIAIIGAARAGFIAAVDPEDDTRRVLAGVKSNLAELPTSLGYQLVDSPDDGCARVQWLGASTHNAQSLIAAPQNDDEREQDDELVEILRMIMDDEGGEIKAADAIKRLHGAGHSPAKGTLHRARKRAGIESRKSDMRGGWLWTYSRHEGSPPDDEGSEGSATQGPGTNGPLAEPSPPEDPVSVLDVAVENLRDQLGAVLDVDHGTAA